MNIWAVKKLVHTGEEEEDRQRHPIMNSRARRIFGGYFSDFKEQSNSELSKNQDSRLHKLIEDNENPIENKDGGQLLGKRDLLDQQEHSFILELSLPLLTAPNYSRTINNIFGTDPPNSSQHKENSESSHSWQIQEDFKEEQSFGLNARNSLIEFAKIGSNLRPSAKRENVENSLVDGKLPLQQIERSYFSDIYRMNVSLNDGDSEKSDLQFEMNDGRNQQNPFENSSMNSRPHFNFENLEKYRSPGTKTTLQQKNLLPENCEENSALNHSGFMFRDDLAKKEGFIDCQYDESAVQILFNTIERQPLKLAVVKKLNSYEISFFRLVAEKARGVSNANSLTVEELVAKLNSQYSGGRKKRLEEEFKLVYKKVMKHLTKLVKQKMETENLDLQKKPSITMELFNRYFKSLYIHDLEFRTKFRIERADGSIDYRLVNQQLIHPTTVNASHLAAVGKSALFMADSSSFLRDDFLNEYQFARITKLKRILANLYSRASRREGDILVKSLGRQLKLPWSTRDLMQASQNFSKACTN